MPSTFLLSEYTAFHCLVWYKYHMWYLNFGRALGQKCVFEDVTLDFREIHLQKAFFHYFLTYCYPNISSINCEKNRLINNNINNIP